MTILIMECVPSIFLLEPGNISLMFVSEIQFELKKKNKFTLFTKIFFLWLILLIIAHHLKDI